MSSTITPSPYCEADIKAQEGLRLVSYPDPISKGPPWTCGYGCTGPDIGTDTVWSMDQAEAAFEAEYQKAVTGVSRFFPWAASMTPVRQDVLIQMAYQMGIGGLLAFKDALKNMQAGKYASAAADMLASMWATQTPDRAKRLANQMRTGVRV